MLTFSLSLLGPSDDPLRVPADLSQHIEQFLGEGNFGAVYKVNFKGKAAAIKIFHAVADEYLGEQQPPTDAIIKKRAYAAWNESEILRKLKSDYIIAMLGYSITPERIEIILEYMDVGTLSWFIVSPEFNLKTAYRFVCHVALALTYLQQFPRAILHRDIKCNNVLLNTQGQAKLADFDTACIAGEKNGIRRVGSPGWWAPEIISHNWYTTATEAFAFAVLMWELVARSLPTVSGEPIIAELDILEGKRLPIPEDCPEIWKSLITDCWQPNPSKRPSASQLSERLSLFYPTSPEEVFEESLIAQTLTAAPF